MHPLKVLSFNVRTDSSDDLGNRWELRKHLAVRVIREHAPDILGTQEPQPHQVRYLEENLSEFVRLGGSRLADPAKGEYSPLHLSKSRFEILESGQFWLSPTPEVAGSMGWDAAYSRIVTWARAKDQKAARTLMILNTHWDNKGQQARMEAGRQVRRFLAENAGEEPVIMTGDLNAGDDNEAIRAFLDPGARPQLLDAYRTCNPERSEDERTCHHYNGDVKGPRIDYIVHTRHFLPLEAAIDRTSYDGQYPSDHFPLAATLDWN